MDTVFIDVDWMPRSELQQEQQRLLALELYLFADIDLSEQARPPSLRHLEAEFHPRRRITPSKGSEIYRGVSAFGNLEEYLQI